MGTMYWRQEKFPSSRTKSQNFGRSEWGGCLITGEQTEIRAADRITPMPVETLTPSRIGSPLFAIAPTSVIGEPHHQESHRIDGPSVPGAGFRGDTVRS